MRIISRLKVIFKRKLYKKRIQNMPYISEFNINPDETEELQLRAKSDVLDVSDKLKNFLNLNMLYVEDLSREIRVYDIKEIIEYISKKNEIRTNKIIIDADIVDEFITLIENEIDSDIFALGELEINISNKNFHIKEFVNRHKKITYILNLKISSLKDLNSDEFDFLNSRYGITYKYSDEDYHLDDLIKTINKFKEFIPSNIQINLEGAQSILNYIFSQFELYVPKEYVEKRKTVKLKSGEEIGLPNFKVVENTNYYTEVENIFKEKTATEKGFRKICREVLKLAGFYIIDNIESFTNTIKKYDLIIDDIKYQIVVNRNGIILQK